MGMFDHIDPRWRMSDEDELKIYNAELEHARLAIQHKEMAERKAGFLEARRREKEQNAKTK